MKKFANNIHYLFYAIFFIGSIGLQLISAIRTSPAFDGILWACLVIGLAFHISKVRKPEEKDRKKWSTQRIIALAISTSVSIACAVTVCAALIVESEFLWRTIAVAAFSVAIIVSVCTAVLMIFSKRRSKNEEN